MEAGFSREIITPWRGLPLAGYFNPRPNCGVRDELYVRTLLFRKDQRIAGVVSLDVCMINEEFITRILARLEEHGCKYAQHLIIAATHTHTAPYMVALFGTEPDEEYLELVCERVVISVLQAERNLLPATLRVGRIMENPEAFNRRYWMSNGSVMTNPGVGNPEIVKVEGQVDQEIGVLAVEQGGRIAAVLANIVNHTDTVGESLVSADWPGRMERSIQTQLGDDPLVVTLIGCSGNVNHIDVRSDEYQGYSYERACKIGEAYATLALTALEQSCELEVSDISVVNRSINIPFRQITPEMLEQAQAVLEVTRDAVADGDLTSEDLAAGAGAVERFFAEQLIEYAEKCAGKTRQFSLLTIRLGNNFVLTSLPGEPFTEIGMAIKQHSEFEHTWIATLAMGACGYVALSESFARGGYETLPVTGGAPHEGTATALIDATCKNLELAGRGQTGA